MSSINQNKRTILVIEDDKSISNFICTALQSGGYIPLTASDGEQAKQMLASHGPDLILLDLGLPDMDGIEIIKWVREWSSVPIIVVSARGREADKVDALDFGADDYITKPFGLSELTARIRTALRHADRTSGSGAPGGETVTVGDLSIDIGKRRVMLGEREIRFTAIEYKVVSLLAKQVGRVLTYDYIIKEIWGPYASSDNQILRVNMANIRRKLEENPAEPKYIVTELGVGYRMLEK